MQRLLKALELNRAMQTTSMQALDSMLAVHTDIGSLRDAWTQYIVKAGHCQKLGQLQRA